MYTIGGVICHHGVLGQKWGQRNGPPYPLSASAHSAAEKKAGYKKSIKGDSGGKSQTSTSSKNVNKQGIAAEIIATIAVCTLPLLSIPVAEAINRGRMHADTKKAQKKLDDIRSKRSGDVDKKTGFKLKSSNSTPEEDLKAVNPLHDNKTMAVNQNCVLCTAAYEMRRRGYDVNANLTEKPLPGMEMYEKAFPGSKGETIKSGSEKFLASDSRASDLKIDHNKVQEFREAIMLASYGENKEHAKSVISEMSKQPNSRGGMTIAWGVGGSHMVAYEVKNGEFMIRDAQVGKTFKGAELENLLASTIIASYIRLDDKKDFNVEVMRRMCS